MKLAHSKSERFYFRLPKYNTILEWISLRNDAAAAPNLKQTIEEHLNVTSDNFYENKVSHRKN